MFSRHRHHHHRHGLGAGFPSERLSRRTGRVFDHGELRLVMLSLIGERPRHGYELIKDIEAKVGGAYSPSPGVVYPTLTLMEELGLVRIEPASGGKKLYRITEEGLSALEAEKEALSAILRRMEAVQERYERPSPRIARAMGNLARAIGVRMAAGPVSETQLDVIIEAIDAAARAVEKA
ncbi:MAG: PadR family transcriptional regulator [Caulobacteraceae bacterium]